MIQKEESLKSILTILEQIQFEDCVPRSIKIKLKEIHNVLISECENIAIRIDKSIQELDEITEDQFVPIHVKTQIWDIVSRLECV